MIVDGLLNLTMWFIELLFSGFSAISLPINLVSVLVTILKYGAWVIGSDLVVIIFTTIIFWLTFKLGAGLILFIWRLLPLT